MSLRVNLSDGHLCWRLPLCRTELDRVLGGMVAVLNPEGGDGAACAVELDVLLVRDAAMAELNLHHMGCHGPTNILSFPLDEPHEPADPVSERVASPAQKEIMAELPVPLGSLVLSVDALHREALLYGQPLGAHCVRLLAHGLGHLAGYDHSAEMDAVCEAMQKEGMTVLAGIDMDCATNEE